MPSAREPRRRRSLGDAWGAPARPGGAAPGGVGWPSPSPLRSSCWWPSSGSGWRRFVVARRRPAPRVAGSAQHRIGPAGCRIPRGRSDGGLHPVHRGGYVARAGGGADLRRRAEQLHTADPDRAAAGARTRSQLAHRVHAPAILSRDDRMVSDDRTNDERRARQRPPEDRPADFRARLLHQVARPGTRTGADDPQARAGVEGRWPPTEGSLHAPDTGSIPVVASRGTPANGAVSAFVGSANGLPVPRLAASRPGSTG